MHDWIDEELLGEEVDIFDPEDADDLLGRRYRGRRRGRPVRRRPMRGRRRGRSRGIRWRAPSASRALMSSNVAPGVPRPGAAVLALGFGNFQIAAAATTVTVNIRPQRPILVRRLSIVTFDVAGPAVGQALVTQFNVGVNSQLVGTSGLPVESFGPLATDIVLAGDVATPGVDVTLTITRTVAPGGAAAQNFAAVLFGESLT